MSKVKLCKNCNAEFTGLFCNQCGQKYIENFTFSKLVKDFFDNILSLDSRLFQSLQYLIIKPGFLTNEYWSGKRITYLPPFRLYLLTSVVHFGMDNIMKEKLEFLQYAFFILMPFMAFILIILYRKNNLLYFHHFITTLHINSTFHLILIINHIIVFFLSDIIQIIDSQDINNIHVLIILIYLFIMMKNIYGESLIRTVIKFAILVSVYAALFVSAILIIGTIQSLKQL